MSLVRGAGSAPRRRAYSPVDVAVTMVTTLVALWAALYSFYLSASLFPKAVLVCSSACASPQMLLWSSLVAWAGIALAFIVGSAGITIAACAHRPMWPWAVTPLALIVASFLIGLAMAHGLGAG